MKGLKKKTITTTLIGLACLVACTQPEKVPEYKEPGVTSYFEGIHPQIRSRARYSAVTVRTDFNNDGLYDLEEIYTQHTAPDPTEVNVREGYIKWLEAFVDTFPEKNKPRLEKLRERGILKIRKPEYFDHIY
ncbi:hypothetical protein KY348_02905 [Candidatus Woesearchaeota archaeon]|nr:hypothetical protein [Candidatus Woesearchaeota archaeon]